MSSGSCRISPVYVLPPDTVCLYSEHRKFFLHGKLYCALVERIGSGEHRASIVRALSGEFPAAEIDLALERLLDRGFIFGPGTVDGPVAGYWASLGLAPEIAAENLSQIGVRIESCGVAGAAELSAALREARGPYRRSLGRPDRRAGERLSRRTASGAQPSVAGGQTGLVAGPALGNHSAGRADFPSRQRRRWTCLADRMKSNRQIKAFLDRKQARCVAASPLAETMLGDSAIGLAAVEIARAIASGFGTDLEDHLISLDLLGSTVARHYVAARPQCPSAAARSCATRSARRRRPGFAPAASSS